MLRSLLRKFSVWTGVQERPLEFSYRVGDLIKQDKNLRKVNLASNTYQDATGKPLVFQSVKKAKEQILATSDHEYLPIEGLGSFLSASQNLALGGTQPLLDSRVASIQTVGVSGGVRIALALVKRFFPVVPKVFISNPGQFAEIVESAGLPLESYSYLDTREKSVNISLLLEEIDEAPRGSVFIFQSSAHNPTGVDLTPKQWLSIQDIMASRRHLAILDLSGHGLAQDLEKDVFPVHLFANQENPLIVVQSFSQNLGLYGERPGCLSVVCDSNAEAGRVLSQLKILARAMYSNPPIFGSRIASLVLGNNDLRKSWVDELGNVRNRLVEVRLELVRALKEKGSHLDWSHLTRQRGLFAYTGLNPEQCSELIDKHHVYVRLDGRINMAGVNRFNIERVAEALETVTRFSKKI